jgi:hypothetical protein
LAARWFVLEEKRGARQKTDREIAHIRFEELEHLERGDDISAPLAAEVGELLAFAAVPDAAPATKRSSQDGAKRAKTRSAHRFVPVHPELRRLGFLMHVEAIRAAP